MIPFPQLPSVEAERGDEAVVVTVVEVLFDTGRYAAVAMVVATDAAAVEETLAEEGALRAVAGR